VLPEKFKISLQVYGVQSHGLTAIEITANGSERLKALFPKFILFEPHDFRGVKEMIWRKHSTIKHIYSYICICF